MQIREIKRGDRGDKCSDIFKVLLSWLAVLEKNGFCFIPVCFQLLTEKEKENT